MFSSLDSASRCFRRASKRIFDFNRRRMKAFVYWLGIFAVPSVCLLVLLLYIMALPVVVLWITIPAVLFLATGLRSYEFQEFGAMSDGVADWTCIALFYVLAAFFLSLVGTRKTV